MVRAIALLTLFITTALSGQDLKLEAFLEAPKPWYPGQVANFIYKISYRGQVQLIEEKLPLLNMEGFEKLGDKTFEDYDVGEYSVQEITQKVRSIHPGTFVSEASILKGAKYIVKNGKKQIIPPPFESQVPPLSITVTPFPAEGKPPSFDGSIGKFNFTMDPIEHTDLRVGDWVQITITAKGSPFLDLLQPPDILCQPGFAGFFQLGDTPIASELDFKNMTKTFQYKIAALNTLPKAIPPITWSTFDPESGQYITWESSAVPIEVTDVTPLQSPYSKVTPLKGTFIKKGFHAINSLPKTSSLSLIEKLYNTLSKNFGFILIVLSLIVLGAYWIVPYIQQWVENIRQDPLFQRRDELFHTKDQQKQMRAWDQVISAHLIQKGYLTPDGQWITSPTYEGLLERAKAFLWELKQNRFSQEKMVITDLAKQGESIYQQVEKLPKQ